jgi:hypothetical protein
VSCGRSDMFLLHFWLINSAAVILLLAVCLVLVWMD